MAEQLTAREMLEKPIREYMRTIISHKEARGDIETVKIDKLKLGLLSKYSNSYNTVMQLRDGGSYTNKEKQQIKSKRIIRSS